MFDKLIDEYVEKVTKDMGAEQRAEVGKELKAHIYDSSEALAAKRGTGVDESIVREVLSKMLSPEKLAAMYPSRETFLKKSGMWKVVKTIAGLAIAFLALAAIIYFVSPGAAGISVGVILSVVSVLALMIVFIVAAFFGIYLYESRLKMTYDTRLRRLVKSLDYPASPLEIGIVIALSVVGLIIMLFLWPSIPFFADISTWKLVPLFSQDFAMFVPYEVALLLATIAIQVLYVVVRQKWVPSLLDSVMGLADALLMFWVMTVFPFNPELSAFIGGAIRVALAICILLLLVDAAKKLWNTGKFFIYGDFRDFQAV